MKILELGKFYPIRGGVEKVMWDITVGVSERGVDCDMLCACEESKVIRLNEHGKVICVRSLAKVAATMISPAMILWLRKHCKEYDIIHIHHPDPMACLALFLSGFRGRVILHWHSDILKQKTLMKFYRPLQGWLVRRADSIVGTTPVYTAESEALAKVQEKIVSIPIGVVPVKEDEKGAAAIRERFRGRKIVYSLGRLVSYKGYEYLVDAAASLDDSYVVAIGGAGPLKEELQRRIEQKGLQDRVFLLGRIPDEDFAAWYRACDVFCLSSIWKTEAFAIVQIEAMSCGKPVVATRIPGSGVSWVNAHGISGLNVEPADAEALAEAIRKVTDENEYAEFCKGALNRYRTMFTFDGMIDRCLSLYGTDAPDEPAERNGDRETDRNGHSYCQHDGPPERNGGRDTEADRRNTESDTGNTEADTGNPESDRQENGIR